MYTFAMYFFIILSYSSVETIALAENRSMKRYGGRSFRGVGGTGRSHAERWRNTNYFSERSDTKKLL